MKQVFLGVVFYANDNEDWLPSINMGHNAGLTQDPYTDTTEFGETPHITLGVLGHAWGNEGKSARGLGKLPGGGYLAYDMPPSGVGAAPTTTPYQTASRVMFCPAMDGIGATAPNAKGSITGAGIFAQWGIWCSYMYVGGLVNSLTYTGDFESNPFTSSKRIARDKITCNPRALLAYESDRWTNGQWPHKAYGGSNCLFLGGDASFVVGRTDLLGNVAAPRTWAFEMARGR